MSDQSQLNNAPNDEAAVQSKREIPENEEVKSALPNESVQGVLGEIRLPIDEHIEEESINGKKVRRRGVYLLPNLFTTAALFSGFYAIISGMHGNFENAAIAIFVAMVLDGLDGRVARLTNTTSAFGLQYDSLSDLVSFGLAPSLVMFSWALSPLHKYGWAVAFVYTACAALRLARFNTQVNTVDKKYFIGLASPSAAALVAGTVWVGNDVQAGLPLSVFSALITLTAALLMVSNIKYQSFKGIDFKGRVPFVVILAVVIVFVVIASNPSVMLLLLAIAYSVSGPLNFLWKWLLKKELVPFRKKKSVE